MTNINESLNVAFDFMHRNEFRTNLLRKKGFKPPKSSLRTQIVEKRLKTSLDDFNQIKTAKKHQSDRKIPELFSNLSMKIFNTEQPQTRKRQKTVSSRKGLGKRLQEDLEFKHQREMEKIRKYINEDNLFRRLSILALQNTKNSLRIYRESFHKVFVERYNKDRITSFLDFEYIQDFDSIQKMIDTLLKMKREEMLLFCFLLYDQDKNGLITPADLLDVIGVESRLSSRNILIEKDVFKIIEYVNQVRSKGSFLLDNVSDDIITQDSLTLTKYRIYKFKEKKTKSLGKDPKIKLRSYNMHKSLFTLNKKESQKSVKKKTSLNVKSLLDFIFKASKAQEEGEKNKFAINFETFKTIFKEDYPLIFIDFLYALGGVTMDDYEYSPMTYSFIFQAILKIKPPEKQETGLKKHLKRLQGMKELNQSLNIEKKNQN